MTTITLPKIEYLELKKRASAYEKIIGIIGYDAFVSPPIRSAKQVMKEFKKTGLYNKSFIKDLENGLKRSSYFVK